MAHVDVSRQHRFGNRGEEVGGEMVRGVGRRVLTVGELVFSERKTREGGERLRI